MDVSDNIKPGQHPLVSLPLPQLKSVIDSLARQMGITTAEEFVSSLTIYQDELKKSVDATDPQWNALVDSARSVLSHNMLDELETPVPPGQPLGDNTYGEVRLTKKLAKFVKSRTQ